MKISKLFISLILSFTMLVSLLPTCTYADELTDKDVTLTANSSSVGGIINVKVTGNPADATYQWATSEERYGPISGANENRYATLTEITGATTDAYVITASDAGKFIRCIVKTGGKTLTSYSSFAVDNLAFKSKARAWIGTSDAITALETELSLTNNGEKFFDGDFYQGTQTIMGINTAGVADNAANKRKILIDLGSEKTFDQLFVKTHCSNNVIKDNPKNPIFSLYTIDTNTELDVVSDADLVDIVSEKSHYAGGYWATAWNFSLKPATSRYVMLVISGSMYPAATQAVAIYEIDLHCKGDEINPTIDSLNGDASLTLAKGMSYVEAGFVATDNCDTDTVSFIDESSKTATLYSADSDGNRVGDAILGPVALDSFTIDTTNIGNFEIEYNVKDVYGNSAEPAIRKIKIEPGIQKDGNLAFGKAIAASSNLEQMYFGADGTDGTSWIPSDADSSPYLILDLDKSQYASNIKIYGNNITGYTLEGSDDNSSWSLVTEAISSDAEFTPKKYRYFKLSLTGSDIELKEAELYYTAKGKAEVAADAISLPTSAISNDLALPAEGLYDSTISWNSSNENVLTKDGNIVSYGASATLTATVVTSDASSKATATRSFLVTVAKKTTSNDTTTTTTTPGNSSGPSSSTKPVIPNNTPIPNDYSNNPSKIPTYSDVPTAHWANEYISKLSEWGIVSGKGNGNFEPETIVKREELVKMIAETLGLTAKGDSSFADVETGAWYSPYIAAAVESGIINGISDDSFGVGGDISRQDICVIVYRAIKNTKPSILENITLGDFADSDMIADYAKEAVGALKALGLIDGIGGGIFAPQDAVTRAQASKILYFMIKQVGSR